MTPAADLVAQLEELRKTIRLINDGAAPGKLLARLEDLQKIMRLVNERMEEAGSSWRLSNVATAEKVVCFTVKNASGVTRSITNENQWVEFCDQAIGPSSVTSR